MTRRSAKMQAIYLARTGLHRLGFDLVREPFRYRFLPALAQRSIDQVLDIGANTGQFGDALRRNGYAGDIVSVEPLRAAHAELAAHIGGDLRWSAERAAVSDSIGVLTMNVADNLVSSSALPMLDRHAEAAPSSAYVATEEVPATTVDDLVARHGIKPERALLKIDVQGFERAVLEGATATLPRFAAVRTELSLVALYEGQALLGEIVELLGRDGFELWSLEPGFADPRSRRLLQVDGVFVR